MRYGTYLGVMTITLEPSGSALQAAFMLCTVPGVKNSQLLSSMSTPCLSCVITPFTEQGARKDELYPLSAAGAAIRGFIRHYVN